MLEDPFLERSQPDNITNYPLDYLDCRLVSSCRISKEVPTGLEPWT
jgi:hypothetical protein